MIITSVQPCFIPWQGYFEQMLLGEIFIYLDDVQYTKKDWRNRNRLLSPNGVKNVHVPVGNAGRNILINEAIISYNEKWEEKLQNQLYNWYKKAPYYKEILALVEPEIYAKHTLLVTLNYGLNQRILDYLGHDTQIVFSSELKKNSETKNDRIIEMCEEVSGDLLYDGKSAANFIDISEFQKRGIVVEFQDFKHKVYPQLCPPPFEEQLSVIDLLMNTGHEAKKHILSNPNLKNPRLNERRAKVSSL